MKIRSFFALLVGCTVFLLVISGCASAPGETVPMAADDDVFALLEKGEIEKAKAYFLGKTAVNSVDSRGRTPLHAAAEIENPDLAAFFISLGADCEALDKEMRTPLCISAEKNDPSVAKVLVLAGANIHAPMNGGGSPALTGISSGGEFLSSLLSPSSMKSTDPQGKNILHLAAVSGNGPALAAILRAGSPPAVKDREGKNALDLALERPDSRNHMECAEQLILADANSAYPIFSYFAPAVRSSNYNIRSADGSAPLHYASRDGYTGLMAFLIERNADCNLKNASGSTPLHEAARSGNIAAMTMLLDKGADLSAQDAKGNTALHLAIPSSVHAQALSLFLSRGANPNIRDVHGESPLHIAVTLNRDPEILQVLLGGGADTGIRNIDGKTPLYLAIEENRFNDIPLLIAYGSDIFAADNAGITPYERALLDKSPVLYSLITNETVSQSDSAGNTLLHITVRNRGDVDVTAYILDQNGLINARNKEGDSALHIAVRQNDEKNGLLLLSRDADIFAPNAREETPLYLTFHSPGAMRSWMINTRTLKARDGLGNSVLHYAAQWKLDTYIPYIINAGAEKEAANATGETPLFIAAKSNGASTVKVLLANGASLNARDSLGNSALHAAVRWNAAGAASVLLDAGIDINSYAFSGKTPLHDAVRLGISDLETLLIRRGANLEARDTEGNTPLAEAVAAGFTPTVERLAGFGADPSARNARGDTPLHAAVAMGRNDLVNVLLGLGASIHARNSRGKTPFTLALASSRELVSTLLTKDRLFVPDDDGAAPLTIAVKEKAPVNMIKAIIDRGAKLDPVDREGRTPLRLALDAGSWDTAKFIADAGADPFIPAVDGKTPAEIALGGNEGVRAIFSGRGINARDSAGNTVLHYAAKNENPRVVSLLLELGANKNVKNIALESPADIALRWRRSEIAALLN
jgi:ankyrin repeat protein